jgi:PhnB protein
MPAKYIPDGFHTVTPYLTCPNVAAVIDFLKGAFDAKEVERVSLPDGRVMHAQVKIGDSNLMMGEPGGEWKAMPCTLYLYVPDCDATFGQALAAGGTSLAEPADQFYGDRHGAVKDGSGNIWWIATHKEDVSPDEMKRRQQEFLKQKRPA